MEHRDKMADDVAEQRLQRLADRVERAGRSATHRCVFLLLMLLNPGHRLDEIRDGALKPERQECDAWLADSTDPDLALAEARRAVEQQERRSSAVDDKSKTMLTISGLMLAANMAILPHAEFKLPSLLALAPVVAAIFLVLMCFATFTQVVVDRGRVRWKDPRETKWMLAKQELACALSLDRQVGFRIGLQRAARRALLLGLLLMIPAICMAAAYPAAKQSGPATQYVPPRGDSTPNGHAEPLAGVQQQGGDQGAPVLEHPRTGPIEPSTEPPTQDAPTPSDSVK